MTAPKRHFPLAGEAPVTPLIVAGAARSGTRFVANLLNQVPGVTIHGEIPPSVMRRVVAVVARCDLSYGGVRQAKPAVTKKWSQSKAEYLYSSWAGLAKDLAVYQTGCRFYGYKSPYHEHFYDFYRAAFSPLRPKYVCCIRVFPQHLFSVQARWPSRSIFQVAQRYSRSLRQIRRIKEQSPDDVLLFFLDDFIQHGVGYLQESLFLPLGLEDTERALLQASKGAANSSQSLGVVKRQRLSRLQAAYLRLDPSPLRLFKDLRAQFGANGNARL